MRRRGKRRLAAGIRYTCKIAESALPDLVSCEVAITGTSGTTFLRARRELSVTTSLRRKCIFRMAARHRRVLLQALCEGVASDLCSLFFRPREDCLPPLSLSAHLPSSPFLSHPRKGKKTSHPISSICIQPRFRVADDRAVEQDVSGSERDSPEGPILNGGSSRYNFLCITSGVSSAPVKLMSQLVLLPPSEKEIKMRGRHFEILRRI